MKNPRRENSLKWISEETESLSMGGSWRLTKVNFRPASYTFIAEKCIRRDMEISTVLGRETKVDIVLPLSENSGPIGTLLEGIARTNVSYRMIFVDDGVKNEEVNEELTAYLEAHPDSRLIRNEQTIGKVSSANRALIMTRSDYVVLLDTDVSLPNLWLERLVMPLVKDPTVASVSPFTNHGLVAGFPAPFRRNRFFESTEVDRMDEVFQEVRSLYTTVPYSIGFCMAMNRTVIHQIGILDQQNYSSLHGADIDWSIRASLAGYRNVMAENLYVEHLHQSSDLRSGERLLSLEQERILKREQPSYEERTEKYLKEDPLSEVRSFAFTRLVCRISKVRRLIFHQRGNEWCDKYMDSYIRAKLAEGEAVALVSYDERLHAYVQEFMYNEYRTEIRLDTIKDVLDLAERTEFRRVIVGSLIGVPNVPGTVEALFGFAEHTGSRIVTMLLDYQVVCPKGTLLNQRREACAGLCENCRECYLYDYGIGRSGFTDDKSWKKAMNRLLTESQEVLYYSSALISKTEGVYGTMERAHQMHRPSSMGIPIDRHMKSEEAIHILIPQDLTEAGGLNLVKGMVDTVRKKKLPVRFYVLGQVFGRVNRHYVEVFDRGSDLSLPAFILRNGIDAALLPSAAPDPIGQKAKVLMEMELPVIATESDGGSDLIERYEKGMILRTNKGEEAIHELIAFAKMQMNEISKTKERGLFLMDTLKENNSVRIESLREYLWKQGIQSDVRKVESQPLRLVSHYDWIILDQLEESKKLLNLLEEANKNEVPVWYMVDSKPVDQAFFTDKKPMLDLCKGFLARGERSAAWIRNRIGAKPVNVIPNVTSEAIRWGARIVLEEESRQDRFHLDVGSLGKQNVDKTIRIGWLLDEVIAEAAGETFYEQRFGEVKKWMDKDPAIRLIISDSIPLGNIESHYRDRMIPVEDGDLESDMLILSQVDVLMLPIPENRELELYLPGVALLASLMQVPVISDARCGLSDWITDGKDGLLCRSSTEWRAAAKQLCTDENAREEMARLSCLKLLKENQGFRRLL